MLQNFVGSVKARFPKRTVKNFWAPLQACWFRSLESVMNFHFSPPSSVATAGPDPTSLTLGISAWEARLQMQPQAVQCTSSEQSQKPHPHFHESPQLNSPQTSRHLSLDPDWRTASLLDCSPKRPVHEDSLPLMAHSACADFSLGELPTLSISHLNKKIIHLKSIQFGKLKSSYPS